MTTAIKATARPPAIVIAVIWLPLLAACFSSGSRTARAPPRLALPTSTPRAEAEPTAEPAQDVSPPAAAPGATPAAAPQSRATPDPWHVRLGVHCKQITPQFARAAHLPVDSGVRVVNVEAGSVAQASGIKVGDVLLKYGDRTLSQISDLTSALAATPRGAEVVITVWRRTGESLVDIQY